MLTPLDLKALVDLLLVSDGPGCAGDEDYYCPPEQRTEYRRLMKLRKLGLVEREPSARSHWRVLDRARRWLLGGEAVS